MEVGLMWYDDDPRKSLEMKIQQAAVRYREKHGCAPTACFVSARAGVASRIYNGMRIAPLRTVRANYLWLGVDDA